MAGGTVVLLQADGAAALVLVLKGENILNGGAPELIDALVVITHHADVFPLSGDEGGEGVLEHVGILILINEHIAEAALPVIPHILMLFQQGDGIEQEIVKIHGVAGIQPAHILPVDLPHLLPVQIIGCLGITAVILGKNPVPLGTGNIGQDGSRRIGLFIHIVVLKDMADERKGVSSVVDGEITGEAQPVTVPAQNSHTGRVEGAGPDVSGALPQKGLQPGLQLAGCLVGEGDGKDLPGRHRVKGGILVSKRPVRGHLLNHLLTGSEWEPVRIGGIAVF